MPFHQYNSIRYFTHDSLEYAGVTHAVFTRQGGVSPHPWASLNVGGLVGDDPKRVLENRVLAFRSVGREPESIHDVWQVHGTEVVCAVSPRPVNVPHLKADVILTDRPDVTIFMRFADCVPVMLYDPVHRVAGIAHAGWQGTVKGTVREAIKAMRVEYQSRPEEILAAIGPSIGPDHYEIGKEVALQVEETFGSESAAILSAKNSSIHCNLWEANRLLLDQNGVKKIEIAGICTACHPEDWYSHRGEKGITGRFGVLIGLV